MQQMGFYDRGLHFLCNKWFSMIEDFIVFATNVFMIEDFIEQMRTSLSLQQMVFMIEDFIVFPTNEFL